ncbi:unnamed protein product, partial [Rotaria magnacalcarata]
LLQLKDQLTRNDFERDKQREDDLVLSMNRRRKTGLIVIIRLCLNHYCGLEKK